MNARKSALLTIGAVALLGLAVAGCKKEDDNKKSTKKVTKNKTTKTKTQAKNPCNPCNPCAGKKKPKMPEAKDVRPKPDEDYIIAEASHAKPKPNDPVTVNFRSFKVIKASFDPKKIVGGTAEIEIDLGGLDSGITKRNGHLKSDDYFGVSSFGKATVKIKDVKKAGDKKYSANAAISIHNVTVTQPIQFEVVSTDANSIRIKLEHKLNRGAFKIGKAVAAGDSVADQVVVKVQLTLKKSG